MKKEYVFVCNVDVDLAYGNKYAVREKPRNAFVFDADFSTESEDDVDDIWAVGKIMLKNEAWRAHRKKKLNTKWNEMARKSGTHKTPFILKY